MVRFIHLGLLTTCIGFASLQLVACDSDESSKSDSDDDDDKKKDDDISLKSVCKDMEDASDGELEVDDCMDEFEDDLEEIEDNCSKKEAKKFLKLLDECSDEGSKKKFQKCVKKDDSWEDLEDCF